MTANKGKTNFMHGFSDEVEELHAYQEMLDYLIDTGRYPDVIAADNDARERVQFCEEMDLYAGDERLKNASVQQRKIHALIHSNKLHDVIAENGGYLPGSNDNGSIAPAEHAGNDGVLPELYADRDTDFYSDRDAVMELDEVSSNQGQSDDDLFIAEPEIRTSTVKQESSFLQLVQLISSAAIIVVVLLAAFRYLFNSDDLLSITKYNFFLFSVLLVVSVAVSEVSSRFMRRLRYAISYLFLVTTASLSGLLFLQQPWTESEFNLHTGAAGVIINYIIHAVITIGPFWLGVSCAVIAFTLLISTWLAGHNTGEDLSGEDTL